MITKLFYQSPSIEALDIQAEGFLCGSDVVAGRPDYGSAVEIEW